MPTPSRIELPRIKHAQPRGDGAKHGPDRVDRQPHREAALSAPLLGQFAARDHERGHDQQEERDGDLDALDRGVKVLADAVDHDVHVRTGETADELRQGQRQEHAPQRRSHPPGVDLLSHTLPPLLGLEAPAAQ